MSTETTAPKKTRQRTNPGYYKYTRRVGGRKWQLRIYTGGGKRNGLSVNLGLFGDEWSAGQAFKRVVRLLRGPLDPVSVWEAVAPLRADGTLPPDVLPMFVWRIPGDPVRFEARIRRGRDRATLGPYSDPAEAGRAALAFAALARTAGGR